MLRKAVEGVKFTDNWSVGDSMRIMSVHAYSQCIFRNMRATHGNIGESKQVTFVFGLVLKP